VHQTFKYNNISQLFERRASQNPKNVPFAFLLLSLFPFLLNFLNIQLEQKQVTPPFKPRLDSERDLANFPPEFTDEPVHLTPDDE
jgi:Protein kinase C terminal domain